MNYKDLHYFSILKKNSCLIKKKKTGAGKFPLKIPPAYNNNTIY